MHLKAAGENFDWVTARDQCSVAAAFGTLCHEIKRSTDKRNALSSESFSLPVTLFDVSESGNGGNEWILVTRKSDGRAVEFQRKGRHILISGYEIDSEAGVIETGLDSQGRCILFMDAAPTPCWRIVSQALDSLFFDEHTDRPR